MGELLSRRLFGEGETTAWRPGTWVVVVVVVMNVVAVVVVVVWEVTAGGQWSCVVSSLSETKR